MGRPILLGEAQRNDGDKSSVVCSLIELSISGKGAVSGSETGRTSL